MEKLLTVTIPTYNAEKYLKTCLDSLSVPELLDCLDVVIINDGSKDRSAEIAETYVNNHPDTFRLVNKENGGHGSGINRGIKEARGLYFKVLDADDWFDTDGLTELISFIRDTEQKPDLISSQFLWVLDNGSEEPQTFERKAQFAAPFDGVQYKKVYNIDDVAEKIYVKFHNLTVRTSLLRENSVTMDEHCYYEDTEYAMYPFAFAKTISFTEKPVYMYRIGVSGQSMSKEKLLRNVKNYDLVMESLLNFYETNKVSIPVKHYFENFIARCHAGRIKIALNMPVGKESKDALKDLEKKLQKRAPEIFKANKNTAVKLLRCSGYSLYLPAALAVRKRGTI